MVKKTVLESNFFMLCWGAKLFHALLCLAAQRKGMVITMDYINAFWVGGLICLIGQILIDKTKLTPARILVLYVVLGVGLAAVGLYEPLVEFAGAGATVPLSGFGYTMAEGIKEAIEKDGALGIITGGVTAAAAGITAAIVFGYLGALIAKPRDKS